MAKVQPMDGSQFAAHFGAARLMPYLEECRQDHALAVELYLWNARTAAAFWIDLGHLEVALRNALDARLMSRNAAKDRVGDWLDDPSGELGRERYGRGKHAQPYKDIASARTRVVENRKEETRDQILSESSFGFWHQMVSKAQTFLWPDLAGAFAHAPDRSQETISVPISKLRHFRNRIAHHHRIWAMDCSTHHDELLTVAGYLDPMLAEWIAEEGMVHALLESRPGK